MTVRKKIGIAVILLLVLLLTVGGVLFFLVMQDDSRDVYQEAPSTDLIAKAVAAAGSGNEMEVSQQELNGFLAYLFEQQKESQQESTPVHSLYFTLGSGQGKAGVYAPCSVLGLQIGITARVDVQYDANTQIFSIRFEEMKAGRVPVKAKWGLSFLSGKLPEGISVQEDSLLIDANRIDWHLGELGSLLKIEGFRIEEGKAYLKTNGMVDALESYLKGQLGDTQWGGLLDEWGGKVKDFLSGLT